jgi:hypothetical protein
MSKLKQLIGLQTSNLSVRELARALGLSIGAVSKYQRAVRAAGIGAAEAENLSEAELEQRVFGPAQPVKAGALVAPNCAWIHNELKRHRHVTLLCCCGRSTRNVTVMPPTNVARMATRQQNPACRTPSPRA